MTFLTQHFSLKDNSTLITKYTSGVTLIQTRFPLNLHLFGNLNNYSKQLETSKQSTSIIQTGQTGLTKISQMGSSLFHDERELILEKPELRTINHFYAEKKVLFLSTVFGVL